MKIPIKLIAATIADLSALSTTLHQSAASGDNFFINDKPVAQMNPGALRHAADMLKKRADQLIECLNGEIEVEI